MTSLARRHASVEDARMPLVEHLRELRSRLFRASLIIVVATAVSWFFYDHLINALTTPYCKIPLVQQRNIVGTGGCSLVVSTVLAPLMLQLQVSVVAGLLLSSPAWLYQIWAFVTPGLHRNERRWALTFLATSVPLFLAGAGLAYWVLPKGLSILLSFVPKHVIPLIQVDTYLRFVIRMMLVFGLAFELPVFVVLLNLVGVVSAKSLHKHRSPVIFLIFVFAAVATPTGDPFNMSLLAIPMCLLYEVAGGIAWLHDRRVARRAAAETGGVGDDVTSPLDTRPSPLEEPSPVAPAQHRVPLQDGSRLDDLP